MGYNNSFYGPNNNNNNGNYYMNNSDPQNYPNYANYNNYGGNEYPPGGYHDVSHASYNEGRRVDPMRKGHSQSIWPTGTLNSIDVK